MLADGTAVLAFKDEDEVDGQPVGPVLAAVMKNGFPVVPPRDFDPNREPTPWVTLATARGIASAAGLPLIEV